LARVRQALRCSSHRTDGEPCRAFAIEGGTVCRVHGGSAEQVRYVARLQQAEAADRRAFDKAYRRCLREREAWQARRVAVTAELLGIPAQEVNPAHIAWCRIQHGRPEGPETEPKMRRDRRYGPRQAAPG
jgi:hypothetical protein